jgi:apolipoprotein N-acyltransferase
VQDWAARFLSAPWPLRTSWVIACAALWVALEMVMARIFGGFPWNFLGASQYRMTPLIQIASFTGEYGLSFVIVWASVSLVGAGAVIIRQPTRRSAWVGEIMLPMLTVTALYLAGYVKLLRPEPVVPELSVALVQPSIPQTLVWDQAENDRRFQDLLKLSERALSNQTDLLIWPESAVPSMFRYDKAVGDPIIALARTHKVWMIINSDDADYSPKDTNYFNSAFLISPDGRLVADYKKQHLVIFGEYVPLTGALPFLKWLTPITGGFTPGTKAARFVLADLGVETSVLICYEDAFATLARAAVDDDTDFLVNLTNDGWFGEGAGQWQHAANAVFRTVENGVPLIRCTNTGLTCWVDANGRIRDVLVAATHGVYGTGFMNIQVPLLPPGTRRVPTFYHQHGDWFGWACVALAALRLLGARRRAA